MLPLMLPKKPPTYFATLQKDNVLEQKGRGPVLTGPVHVTKLPFAASQPHPCPDCPGTEFSQGWQKICTAFPATQATEPER